MENHKVNSNEMLLNEADFMLAVLQTYEDIAYLKEKHRTLYSDKMQLHMLNQLVKLESFIDENKVDWEQLYFSCLEIEFSEVQVVAIKSLLNQTPYGIGMQEYRNLYKSFRYLRANSSNLYQSVIDNINTYYYSSDKLSLSVETADKLYTHYYDCKRLISEYLDSISLELMREQNAALQKNLVKSIFFYYILDQEIFMKGYDLSEVVAFVEDKEKFKELKDLEAFKVSFQNKSGNKHVDFLSEVVVKDLKEVCQSYTTKRLAMNIFDEQLWNDLRKEKLFWNDNKHSKGRRLFNSFLRSVIQAFIDSDVEIQAAEFRNCFDLVRIDEEKKEVPIMLTQKLASYAYDLLGLVMFNAIEKSKDSEKGISYEMGYNFNPSPLKANFVKTRLKQSNDGYIIMEEDPCNGFELVIASCGKKIRELPFNLLF